MSDEALVAAERLARGSILWNLKDKLEPAHTALIVIDVQNDFCSPDGMMAAEGHPLGVVQAMAGRIPGTIAMAREAGVLVIFVRNVYSTATNHYLSDAWLEQATRRRAGSYTTREVCAEGSFGWEFYQTIAPQPDDPIVTKHRFNAFHNTDLEVILRAKGIRTVALCGVASNVCVETTAREAFIRDYYVVFSSDGTATYDDASHEATLRTIDRFFGEVRTLDEIEACWAASPTPGD